MCTVGRQTGIAWWRWVGMMRIYYRRRRRVGGEIIVSRLMWPIVNTLVETGIGRGLGGATGRHINEKGIVGRLSAGKVGVQGSAHGLVGLQVTRGLVAGRYPDGQVGGIKLSTERVGIFPQDHVAHVVNQVVLVDGDERGRGTGPLDPNLPGHHVGAYGQQLVGISHGVAEVLGMSRGQQGLDEGRLPVGEEALAPGNTGTGGSRRGSIRQRQERARRSGIGTDGGGDVVVGGRERRCKQQRG